jgi:neurotransmitter-gated ion-channel
MILAAGAAHAQEESSEDYLSEVRPGSEGQQIPVNIGVAVIDIDGIDGAQQSFVANFAVSAQWKDPRLAKDTGSVRIMDLEDVWTPNLQILNQQKLFKTFPDKVEVSPDGTVIYRQRFWGTLSYPMNLKDFPLDHHSLQIKIVSVGNNAEDIKFTIADDRTGMGDVLTVTDWKVLGWDIFAEPIKIGPTLPVLHGVVFEFEASRLVNFYIIKVLVPLVMIVFMSLIVLFIDPSHVGPKFSIAITAILTLIAYRFLLGGLLPKISYLTHMDYFLFGSMFLVFAVLVETSIVARLMGVKKEGPAKELDYWSRWAFVVLFILILVASFFV